MSEIHYNDDMAKEVQLPSDWQEWPLEAKVALLERLKEIPTPKPLAEMIGWKPQPRQAVLLKAAGVYDAYFGKGPLKAPVVQRIGYGGAAGGGKSDALIVLAATVCYVVPGALVMFFRRTYPELRDGPINRAQYLLSPVARLVGHDMRFPNGSLMKFRHVQQESDLMKYKGPSIDVLIVDEATDFPWKFVDFLLTRNRSPKTNLTAFSVFASNPGGVGHAWMSQLFDIQDLSGGALGPHERVKEVENPNGKRVKTFFVPAKLDDNQELLRADPGYRQRLEEREAGLADAYLRGNWQVFEGQAFPSWRRERHVIKPNEIPVGGGIAEEIPAHWPRFVGIDWGYTAPFAALWGAVDPDTGRVIVYRELYQTGLTDIEQARLVKAYTMPEEKIVRHYADPSMWTPKNFEGITYSTADQYMAEGIYLYRADNDRRMGMRRVQRMLAPLPDGLPGLLATEDCKNLIRTMPLLPLVKGGEDVDTRAEDHAYDALRYLLTGASRARPWNAKKKKRYRSPWLAAQNL